MDPQRQRREIIDINSHLEQSYQDHTMNNLEPKQLTCIMSTLNKVQAYASTIQWFERANKLSIKTDNYHYSIVITACPRSNDFYQALRYFEDMKREHIKPNTITYNAAISACEKGNQWEKALQLLQQMQHDHIQPNTITYSVVIGACYKADMKDHARTVYIEAFKNSCTSHWASCGDGVLDFHGHTRYTAAAGLYVAFQELLSSSVQKKCGLFAGCNEGVDYLSIVTGKGLHSAVKGECVVRDEIQRVLEKDLEPRVQYKVDPSNTGRLLVSKSDVEEWVKANHK